MIIFQFALSNALVTFFTFDKADLCSYKH